MSNMLSKALIHIFMKRTYRYRKTEPERETQTTALKLVTQKLSKSAFKICETKIVFPCVV